MMKELYTERLYLRKMTVDDASSLFKIWSDPDVTRFMNIDHFTEEDQAKDIIMYLDELSQENKAVRFSIIEQQSNQIIGSCGYNFLDFENAKTEIGYDIAKIQWGKGYAPEAVSALVDHAFHSLNFNRIEAKVEPENINSIKVLQKLTFTFEGTLRQYEKVKGKFIDLNLYSRLKSD
ncbi:GNAT family N-acetyltransferase [Pseudobacillus wudalianchiensis]|uniref:GNAT family acetyltransferase n=1 Tax=Pseudobacillus wudalianchiensis TaxID=1743143 RepID=A0A1B9ANC9_9BACI|nr:GNAT family protein [Bacillus wudalianchiensis]OCA85316.1 GNAT family acetyltransferase [Bacillus wudalianchiensis]